MKRICRLLCVIMSISIIFSTIMPMPAAYTTTREVVVSSADELLAALSDARAGDEIILKPGVYQNDTSIGVWAAFYSPSEGTAENPIILRSEDAENPATICGVTQENKMALYITGDYWIIKDLCISNAQKGIILDNSNHSIITGCEVFDIGTEAIHIRDDSCYNLVENCYVHDAGTVTPQYGEGVYIGSSKNTDGYGYECHYNVVRNCRFGPNIAADHVDIKEYTIGNLVEGCTFDGTGMQGLNGGDSFVEIKGNYNIVRNNVGYRNGCEKVLYAFDLNVQLDGWGQYNKIYDNTVYLDTTDCYIAKAWNCETMVFRNTVTPEDTTYSGNKMLQVVGFELTGDSNEDGQLDYTDAYTLKKHLMGESVAHISLNNSDMITNENLDIADMVGIKRQLLDANAQSEPVIFVDFTKEAAGKWRMCNGLGSRTVTFTISAQAGAKLNMGWGYWDPNGINESTGASGVWNQISLGTYILDENGNTQITVSLPVDVTSVALQVYDYQDDSGSLDKDSVTLVSVATQ